MKDQIPSVQLPLQIQDEGEKNSDERKAGEVPLATVRLIAGELNDMKGPATTFSPVQMWDVIVPVVGQVDIPFPAQHNCILFVRRGGVKVLSGDDGEGKQTSLGPQDLALMHLDGSDVLRIHVDQPDTSVIILGGEPLNEPIAAQGPFVMNSFEEIQKANMDYRMGKF